MVINNQKTEENKGILQPKNDIVFHALFSRGKERITKALLEDILKIKIDKLELDKSTELSNDNVKDKNGRLDLRAVINGNVECNIEMQLVSHEKMLERFVYYWAKTYTANLQVGQPYKSLRKVISIIIVDNEIKEFKDIEKSHTKWRIREDEYKEKVLTPHMEIDILEMQKAIREYENNSSDKVLQWMKFLNNPEETEVVKIMEKNKDIKEAKDELDLISRDDTLRWLALRAEITRMDNEQYIEDAENRGMKKGKEEGIKEGAEQGKKDKAIEIAKKLLSKGIDINEIIEITGLTKEEIEKL